MPTQVGVARNTDDQDVDYEGFSVRGGMWLCDREDTAWILGTKHHATWPFAELRATRERLTVSAPRVGTFTVTRGNLASITLFGGVPVIAHGLRFEAYLRRQVAVFWTGRRSSLIAELADVGWNVDDRP